MSPSNNSENNHHDAPSDQDEQQENQPQQSQHYQSQDNDKQPSRLSLSLDTSMTTASQKTHDLPPSSDVIMSSSATSSPPSTTRSAPGDILCMSNIALTATATTNTTAFSQESNPKRFHRHRSQTSRSQSPNHTRCREQRRVQSSSDGKKKTIPAAPKSGGVLSIADLAYAELAAMKKETTTDNQTTSTCSSPTKSTKHSTTAGPQHSFFPSACRNLLLELPGNTKCIDCGNQHPEWAAISYGALVCIQCSGQHRSLGVQTSTVRHVTMDHWTYPQVIKMLEGGNQQLQSFFERHALTETTFVEQQQNKSDNATTTESSSTTSSSSVISPTSAVSSLAGTNKDGNNSTSSTTISSTTTLTISNLLVMRYKTKAAVFYRQQLEQHVQQLLKSKQPYQGRKKKPNTATIKGR